MSNATNETIFQDSQTSIRESRRTRRWVVVSIILSVIAIVLALIFRGCDTSSQQSASTLEISTSSQGIDGLAGAAGISAYELWKLIGNTGSEQDFLDSLVGQAGSDGYVGETGLTGPLGLSGVPGKSAFELWLAAGYTGSTDDFLNSLLGSTGSAGVSGLSAYQLWLTLGHIGSETDFLNSLIGVPGIDGLDGLNGLSAYQSWLLEGHAGATQTEFLASLIGPTGATGLPGVNGVQGIPGETGAQGVQGVSGLSGLGASASYFSTLDQAQATANTIQPLSLNATDWATGISLQSGTRLSMLNSGKFNIAFSIQLHQLNSSGVVNIWLAKNGVAVENTNTKMAITANNPYYVAAWNFFVDAQASDYYEIMWSSSDNHTVIEHEPATVVGGSVQPAVPSVIVTVNQVG